MTQRQPQFAESLYLLTFVLINGYGPNLCLESCLLSQLIGLVDALTLL